LCFSSTTRFFLSRQILPSFSSLDSDTNEYHVDAGRLDRNSLTPLPFRLRPLLSLRLT
jgi:hypothetical protein